MMRKKCSTFHRCTLRGLNFIETVYELFDNPSYMFLYHVNKYQYLHCKVHCKTASTGTCITIHVNHRAICIYMYIQEKNSTVYY